ncbi:MFS transporter [Pseudarthrobacter sp. NamE2]|uniref:MFS transporter n=1 Tax=Pseudarthrobacter sp. NamE2 TaxID=2576838 RepID=UPI0010FDD5D7|nr:MFS transporter [Pseudarthrobacter sp. NamE2]TLM83594.1 MFS transporter [Pseudarthrobacter sp. NamE2]
MTTPTSASPADTIAAPPRLPLYRRAAFGLGDFAGQLVWTTVTSYLAVFYTETVGLGAGVVALLLLVTRVVDALIDPLVGALAERTRSRYGRFRPWLLYGIVPLGITFVLTFTAPFPGSSASAVVWAAVTYGILGILYSVVNVPYGALPAVMTESATDRVSLNSFRMIGTNAANVLLSLLTLPVIVFFSGAGDGRTQTVGGYTLTATVFAVLSVGLMLVVFATSREVITPVKKGPAPIAATARAIFTNRPLMLNLIGTFLVLTAFFGRLGVVIFYALYNVQNFALVPVLMSTPAIAAIIGIVVFTPLARRFGKRNLLITSLLGQSVSLFTLFFVGFDNIMLVLALSFVYGLSTFGTPLVLAMVPDAVDYGEERSGIRTDGSSYATISFSTKIASAVGGGAGVALIGAFGFVPKAQQTAEAMNGINIAVNLVPAIITLLAIVPYLFYNLTESRVAEIRARLDARGGIITDSEEVNEQQLSAGKKHMQNKKEKP